ncbi:MAG: hypothetical protein EBZ48_09435 [Proteobacteria bacterium]|nr:hypothetical protein [Pseudomonadota bacterium]
MFFDKRHHPLPAFPPGAAATFRRLCKSLPPSEIPELLQSLERCVDEIRSEAKDNPLLQLPLIESLHDRARFLLEQYEQFPESQRKLIIGAVYYFAIDQDSSPDVEFATGFDDDAKVMNHVLEELGIEGMFIEI